jgi:hypothetical protein
MFHAFIIPDGPVAHDPSSWVFTWLSGVLSTNFIQERRSRYGLARLLVWFLVVVALFGHFCLSY